jgi:hypothetical protein
VDYGDSAFNFLSGLGVVRRLWYAFPRPEGAVGQGLKSTDEAAVAAWTPSAFRGAEPGEGLRIRTFLDKVGERHAAEASLQEISGPFPAGMDLSRVSAVNRCQGAAQPIRVLPDQSPLTCRCRKID